jgi:lipopolysaccharide transport system ATP-binding protein
MSRPVIKVENLSKAYQIGQIGTGTISRDLERWWVTKVRRKEDPFLQIGEVNDRTSKGKSNIVWSLRDINFEIKQGDAVGIIGRNGAGKSTLLKILSRVTAPTSGKFKVKGRIASLLEVGTGFHPELSGRENIYLNGAILGMRRKEIDQKFDEIVDFSGVERYIDTPVKRYSSGMYVRLAFAVAAHLESEILIVDEVLAVGDMEFQKKCLGKMGEVSKGQGRTILFVSHNLPSIIRLCQTSILLGNGQIQEVGITRKIVSTYSMENTILDKRYSNPNNILQVAEIINLDNKFIELNLKFDLQKINVLNNVEIIISDENLNKILFFGPTILGIEFVTIKELCDKTLRIHLPNLVNGKYYLSINLVNPGISLLEENLNILGFEYDSKSCGANDFIVHNSHNVGNIVLNNFEII